MVILEFLILKVTLLPITFLGHQAPPSISWSKRARCGPTDLKSKAEEAVISSSLMWPFSMPRGRTQVVEPMNIQ